MDVRVGLWRRLSAEELIIGLHVFYLFSLIFLSMFSLSCFPIDYWMFCSFSCMGHSWVCSEVYTQSEESFPPAVSSHILLLLFCSWMGRVAFCSPLFTSWLWWGWSLTLHPTISAAENADSAVLLKGREGYKDLSLSTEFSNLPAFFSPSVFWCLLYIFHQGFYLYLAEAMG